MFMRKILIMGLVGYALGRVFSRPRPGAARPLPARDRAPGIRQSGPREMKDPPRDWDLTDERSDESFPASDPPGNY
jgi:hypothetical protein